MQKKLGAIAAVALCLTGCHEAQNGKEARPQLSGLGLSRFPMLRSPGHAASGGRLPKFIEVDTTK
jgi:hypothetical protein